MNEDVTVALQVISDRVVQLKPSRRPQDYADVTRWNRSVESVLVQYYSDESVYVMSSNADWSFGFGRDDVRSVVIRLPPSPRDPGFLSSYFSRLDATIAADIVSSNDFPMNLLWITRTNPSRFICDLLLHMGSVDAMLMHFMSGAFHHDLFLPTEDGETLYFINPIKDVSKLLSDMG